MKRAARIIRSGSSENDSSGVSGVRRIPAARSAAPPCGSTSRGSEVPTSSAMEFTVKSRRARSSVTEWENTTCGLRLSSL